VGVWLAYLKLCLIPNTGDGQSIYIEEGQKIDLMTQHSWQINKYFFLLRYICGYVPNFILLGATQINVHDTMSCQEKVMKLALT
jgi:hypothetical protein